MKFEPTSRRNPTRSISLPDDSTAPETQKMKFERYERRFEEAVLELHRTALVGFSHGYAQEEEERDLREIDAVYLHGGGEFLVGFAEGRLVAMGGFRIVGATFAEVKRVRILPEVQGGGIGSALIECLETIARARGVQKFVLDSAAARPKTLQFWLKHGFVQTGETMYGTQPTVRFEKLLNGELDKAHTSTSPDVSKTPGMVGLAKE